MSKLLDNKLNKRQEAYCYWRARDKTIEQSMEKAAYTCKGASARATGSQLENNPNIVLRIEQEKLNIFDKKLITEEYILENLNKIALNAEQEANKVRAIELLGKYLAMFKEHHINEDLDSPFNFGKFRSTSATVRNS